MFFVRNFEFMKLKSNMSGYSASNRVNIQIPSFSKSKFKKKIDTSLLYSLFNYLLYNIKLASVTEVIVKN